MSKTSKTNRNARQNAVIGDSSKAMITFTDNYLFPQYNDNCNTVKVWLKAMAFWDAPCILISFISQYSAAGSNLTTAKYLKLCYVELGEIVYITLLQLCHFCPLKVDV